jgi:putative Holliday junction resolvase
MKRDTPEPSAVTSSQPESHRLAQRGIVLAFDYGLKRTGAAIGEIGTGLCRPLGTFDTSSREKRWNAVQQLLREWAPARLVVGLPLDADGSEQEATRRCRNFATELESVTGLPVALVDERFSSLEADQVLRQRGLNSAERAAEENGEAAAIILRSYLESMES